MVYYIREVNGVIKEFATKDAVDSGRVQLDYTGLIDYEPIQYKHEIYTKEKFAEIQATQEYKDRKSVV